MPKFGIRMILPNINISVEELGKQGENLNKSINDMKKKCKDKKKIDESLTFTGLLKSKNDLGIILDSVLFLGLKCAVYIKRQFFYKKYYVVISGKGVENLGHCFKSIERASAVDIKILKKLYGQV